MDPISERLRARHPQVKALVGRLNESDRDLARQWLLVGKPAEARALQRTLDTRRAARLYGCKQSACIGQATQTHSPVDATRSAQYD